MINPKIQAEHRNMTKGGGHFRIIQLFMGAISLLMFIQGIVSQQQEQHQKSWPIDDPSADTRVVLDNGERVDKFSSASGDLFWRPASMAATDGEQQADWLRQLSLGSNYPMGAQVSYYSPYAAGMDGGPLRNYHALVDEFKQYSPLANPTREGRAFKPKLMSTARGFGKRASQESQARHVTYADLLAAANQNAPNANGKLSGSALR